MTIGLTVNGTTYQYPSEGDSNWGPSATAWAQAMTGGCLQKAGGNFVLTADVDFGATYGLKIAYAKSRAASVGSTGVLRLGNDETVVWRNAADTDDLVLRADTADQLTFNGVPLGGAGPGFTLSAIGSSPNANGASISGASLILQPANGTYGGVVTAGAQTIAGVKTFASAPVVPAGSASAPSIGFTGDTTTGIYRSASATIGFAGAGAALATLASGVLTFPAAIEVASASKIRLNGGLRLSIQTIASGNAGSLGNTGCVVFAQTTLAGGGITVTLPTSGASETGRVVMVSDSGGNANTEPVYVKEGSTTKYTISSANGGVVMVCDGSNWYAVANR